MNSLPQALPQSAADKMILRASVFSLVVNLIGANTEHGGQFLCGIAAGT
jgi:hypothetical protein